MSTNEIRDMISKYTHDEVWDEITYPLPIFNDAAIQASWGMDK